ncbi:MAG: presenilin family intramembrane aspartyl protease [Candidatus Micrarchaeia archaeon]
MEFRRIENRQLIQILSLFLIVQFGGLLLVMLPSGAPANATPQAAIVSTPMQSLWYALYIVFAALILVLVLRIYHGEMLFKIIEAFVVITASFFVFLVVISYALPSYANIDMFAALVCAVLMILAKNKVPSLRNTVTVIASMGVGIVLGVSFSFAAAFFLFFIIAIYDFVAVFITKHMITMAKALSSRNLAFLISSTDVEAVPKSYLSASEIRNYSKYISEVKHSKNATLKRVLSTGRLPIVSQIQLGAGDLGIPLMMAISAAGGMNSFFFGFVVVAGSAAGIVFTMLVLRKYQIPLPAIPPIISFVSLALAVAFFIGGYGAELTGIMLASWLAFLVLILFGAKRAAS